MSTVRTKKKKKMRTGDKVMLTIAIIMIVVAVLALAVIALMNSSIFQDSQVGEGGFNNSYATDESIRDKQVNFLLCGVDKDKGRGTNLTDVIMVVNYDISAKKVNILQIPRDTVVDEDKYPTGGTHKINAIYNQSIKKYGNKAGINGLVTAINENFKLPIDHYVTVTMEDFRGIVDALGGLEITSDYAFTSVDGYKIKKGTQLMDGQTAEAFVRERKHVPGGDATRQKNQRVFLSALMDRLLEATAADLAKMVPTLVGMVGTDMTPNTILEFAKMAQGLEKSNIIFHSLPGKYGSYDGYSVFSMNAEKTAELLNQYFRPYSDPVAVSELGIKQVFDTTTVEDDAQPMQ